MPTTEPDGRASATITVELRTALADVYRARLAAEARAATTTRSRTELLALSFEPQRILARVGAPADGSIRLDEALAAGPLPRGVARALLDGVAKAIRELATIPSLDGSPRLHARLCPAAVVIEPSGLVRLIGPGLPFLDALLVPTAEPTYPSAHGPGSDAYGLARITAEALLGSPIANALARGEAVPAASPAISEILARGLAPDPTLRFPDLVTLWSALAGSSGPPITIDVRRLGLAKGLARDRPGAAVFAQDAPADGVELPTIRLSTAVVTSGWAPLAPTAGTSWMPLPAAPLPHVSAPAVAPAAPMRVSAPPHMPPAPMPEAAAPGSSEIETDRIALPPPSSFKAPGGTDGLVLPIPKGPVRIFARQPSIDFSLLGSHPRAPQNPTGKWLPSAAIVLVAMIGALVVRAIRAPDDPIPFLTLRAKSHRQPVDPLAAQRVAMAQASRKSAESTSRIAASLPTEPEPLRYTSAADLIRGAEVPSTGVIGPPHTMTIDSYPSGATVWINGRQVGRTPFLKGISYPPGHILELELELRGYVRYSTRATVADSGDLDLRIPLDRARR